MMTIRRVGRVGERGGLENRCTARYRGFESLPLRQSVEFMSWLSDSKFELLSLNVEGLHRLDKLSDKLLLILNPMVV